MKKVFSAGAALLVTTSMATAGGLDRSGFGISPLFEDGNYVELSFGLVMPSVSGVDITTESSGNMAQDYTSLGFAFKTDITDNLAVALIWEEAYGADITYNNNPAYTSFAGPSQIYGFDASLSGNALSAIAKYQVNERFSVHGGLRYVTMGGTIDFTGAGFGPIDYGNSSDVGWVAGASYEIPDIALRATLTYNSATTHNNALDDGIYGGALVGFATETGEYTMPQSVNLDFQTGIAADTLLMASIRWAQWTETVIDTQSSLGTIDYDNDVYTYSLGVARRFSDSFAGVVRFSYEDAKGGQSTNLAPTDGSLGVTLAGVYTMDDITLTAGINYTWLGDTTTEGVNSTFADNSALGIGVKVGYSF